ncbi:MAG: hypothetical protein AAF738_07545, partial [Bacteroidota bacterium]
MKTKLVLWGKQAEERVLTAIELKAKENKVGVYIFPTAIATDDFANELMQNWRDGKEVNFPEGYTYTEKELSVTDSILPEDITLERADLLSRAQTEWHFVVLSSKLYEVYHTEANEIKEKIAKLNQYDSKLWDQLKTFWGKVQEQVKEQNLFREHADSLRGVIDGLFNDLKGLRSKMESEFQERSQKTATQFSESLDGIEKRIGEGTRLSTIFEELKGLQRKFRDAKFTREDQTRIWKRLDGAFKAVKEKRYGPNAAGDDSAMTRLTRRMSGLKQAIARMEKSIKRDEDDLAFQQRKIARTDGQLESQIRQAKIKMIEERVRSKRERLDDMHKTETQVQKQIERQKVRDEKRAEREKIEAAKKEAQAKIQADMDAKTAALENEKLAKAAAAIQGNAPAEAPDTTSTETPATTTAAATTTATESEPAAGEETILSAVSNVVTETVTDVVDTVKAVASVVGDKALEAIGIDEEEAAEKSAVTLAKEVATNAKEEVVA